MKGEFYSLCTKIFHAAVLQPLHDDEGGEVCNCEGLGVLGPRETEVRRIGQSSACLGIFVDLVAWPGSFECWVRVVVAAGAYCCS